ncbi:MAG: lipid A deacylase LpxR family protein [Pseudomonadales bacterium]|nr:lipid A deacylase LpxR family protein [Pseudomonadales bacterium]MCP5182539.1 lipid A deacylase LpxR family protein [Pseudomonadales bacterium]
MRLLTITISCLLAVLSARADGPPGVLSLLVENDVIAGTDRHYTSGVMLAYVSDINRGPRKAERFGRRLPFLDDDDDIHISFALGHEIYTPAEITEPDLIVTDRPYAGYLYGAVGFTTSDADDTSTWRLDFGIVGPSARGKEIQRGLHRRIDTYEPRGWSHQLKDEPVLNAVYEKKWRLLPPRQNTVLAVDLLPHLGGAVGNLQRYVNAGLTLRIGRHLESDYGPPRIRPALPGSLFFNPKDGPTWYFYAGVDGRYVEHNLFLDGNTWKHSHSVDKLHWVGDVQAGFVINTRALRLAYSFVWRSREFRLQEERNRFGSLTLAYRF